MKKLYVSICLLILVAAIATEIYFLAQNELKAEDFEVLAILADGFDYMELHGFNSTLAREGIKMTTASFTANEISGSFPDFRGYKPDITFDEVGVSLYDVVFIPGGSGPENIISHPDKQKVFDILTQAHNEGKVIAAICHGPWVLAAANLVNGTDVTCFNDPDMIIDLINSGATVDTSQSVTRDKNIITAFGPQDVDAFAEEIISVLIEKHGLLAHTHTLC